MQTCIPEAASAHRTYCEARAAHRAAGELHHALHDYLPPAAAQVWAEERGKLTNRLLDARTEWLQKDPEAWLSREAVLEESPFNESRLISERTAR